MNQVSDATRDSQGGIAAQDRQRESQTWLHSLPAPDSMRRVSPAAQEQELFPCTSVEFLLWIMWEETDT